MRKLAITLTGALLAGCFGYQPIYSQSNMNFDDISVENVTVMQDKDAIGKGKRRVAQIINRKLKEVFVKSDAPYSLDVEVNENENALAVQRDATEERVELILQVKLSVKDMDGVEALNASFEKYSYYNIQNTPFATEAGITRAREYAAESAAEEVVHRVTMFLSQQGKED